MGAQPGDHGCQPGGRHRRSFSVAAIAPGERVLDIGCGSGETSLMAAKAVGPGRCGDRTGYLPTLLALAGLRAEGIANLSFIEADASVHDFKPEFDLLLSRFGVMFFDDPLTAFANIRKAAAPGGRLAFVCWRALGENEYAAMPFDLSPNRCCRRCRPPNPHAPDPLPFAIRIACGASSAKQAF